MTHGLFTAFSVTSDGSTMVVDEGTYDSDSVHVAIATRTSTGRLQFGEYDTRTGAQRNRFEPPDSTVRDFFPMPDGWAWIPAASDRLVVLEGGCRREFAKPAWFGGISHLVVDPARRRVLYTGWGGPGADSVGMGALSLDDGTQLLWASKLGDAGRLALADAHDAVFIVSETSDTWTLYGADGPGRLTKLGTIGRPLASVTVSRDLKRIVANVRDYRADAWMSRVIRP